MADENWETALSRMPLDTNPAPLNRDNCMPLMLGAFQSNAVIKALIFLPAVADDFYLLNRDQPKLNIRAANLREAVVALTNATAVRASFRFPFLLLHLQRDNLEPIFVIRHAATAIRLKEKCHLPQVLFNDRHWERVQPLLEQGMGVKVLPAAISEDAWHFNRHNLAGSNLTDWEVLSALSLAGKTSFTVGRDRIVFQVPQGR